MNTLTVSQLIQRLQDFPPDALVKFEYDYGDYWHTKVCQGVKEIEDKQTIYSEYHRLDKALDQNEDTTELEDRTKENCVIIS